MNMVYNNGTGTVLILDNSTTGMTGHQDHAATGRTLQGDPTYAIDIPALCRSIGVKNVTEVNAFDLEALEEEWNRYGLMEYVDVHEARLSGYDEAGERDDPYRRYHVYGLWTL